MKPGSYSEALSDAFTVWGREKLSKGNDKVSAASYINLILGSLVFCYDCLQQFYSTFYLNIVVTEGHYQIHRKKLKGDL